MLRWLGAVVLCGRGLFGREPWCSVIFGGFGEVAWVLSRQWFEFGAAEFVM